MLKDGKIRTLPPNAPNPYPDTIMAETAVTDTGEDCVLLGKPDGPKPGGSLLTKNGGRH